MFEAATDEEDLARLTVALRLAELESRLAEETLALREMEKRNQDASDALYRLRLSFLTEKVAWIESRAQFTQDDLAEQLNRVARNEFVFKRTLAEAKLDLDAAAQRVASARLRRDAAGEMDQALVEEVEAARLAREVHQLDVMLTQARLQRLVLLKQLWTRRFSVFNGHATTEDLKTWEDETADALTQLDSESRLQTDEAAEARKSLVTLREKLDIATVAGPEVARWLREQIRHVETLIGSYESNIAGIETARRLCERLAAEIASQTTTISFGKSLAELGAAILAVWRYELASVEDRPITVSKIVVGILLLVIGMGAARFLSRFVGRRLLPRVGVNEGAAAAIQSLLFYALALTLVLVLLRIVNVPLTAFTIVGGALAIGVGFGSQNLINNFISGLILLMERPIRVGDLIEIEDLLGSVEHIGPRSTRVRSADNVDIIVPNSSFLQQNVVNWTLSDDRYRAHVGIGLAYGSPTREAAKLIRRAVEEHGKILKTPKAVVLFTEFGDNALNFEVHFWLRMRRLMDRKMIESDIRYRIDVLFREAGIVVAFPQRDIHFDAAKPVEVRVLADQSTNQYVPGTENGAGSPPQSPNPRVGPV
ncbi:MAG: mechanosensitive ion channel family protein [Planctomycetota bacterium]